MNEPGNSPKSEHPVASTAPEPNHDTNMRGTMRITVAYNLRTDASEETAELLTQEDVDRICGALRELRHQVSPVEVSGQPDEVVDRLLDSAPDLIFNWPRAPSAARARRSTRVCTSSSGSRSPAATRRCCT